METPPPTPSKCKSSCWFFFFLRIFFLFETKTLKKLRTSGVIICPPKKTETKHTHLQTFFFSSEFFYCERPSSQRIVTPVVDTPTSCHAHRLGSLAVSAKKKTEICWWFFSCTFRVCVCVCYFAAIFFFFWKNIVQCVWTCDRPRHLHFGRAEENINVSSFDKKNARICHWFLTLNQRVVYWLPSSIESLRGCWISKRWAPLYFIEDIFFWKLQC